MALGTSNTSAQARGKNKATKRRKGKEVDAAKNYTLILSTARQGSSACAIPVGANQYYHDGSSAFPAVDDKIYSRKRTSTKYYPENGHYRMHVSGDERTTKNIEISSGAVTRVTPCP